MDDKIAELEGRIADLETDVANIEHKYNEALANRNSARTALETANRKLFQAQAQIDRLDLEAVRE